MRVNPINPMFLQANKNCKTTECKERYNKSQSLQPQPNNVNFKGLLGKLYGGGAGMMVAASIGVIAMGGAIIAAPAALAAYELAVIGGGLIGAKIGDKIQGKDSE